MLLLNGQPIYLPNRSMFSFPSGSLKALGGDLLVTLRHFLPRVTNFRVNLGGNICPGVPFESERFHPKGRRRTTLKCRGLTNWIPCLRCEWVSGFPRVRLWPHTDWSVPSANRLHPSVQGPDDRRHLPRLLRLHIRTGGDEVHQNRW